MKALSHRNIMSGFLASGLCPLDVQRAINALKPRERKHKSFDEPTTPRKRQVIADTLWGTPEGSADVQKQLEDIDCRGDALIHDFKCIIRKAMKCIDQKNSQIQRLEEEKAIQRASAAAREPTGRVPVQFDPNLAFPKIEQIISARDQRKRTYYIRLKETRKNNVEEIRQKHKQ
jgi:hypothetical protein